MPRSAAPPLSKLPRVPETWLVGIAQLRIWISPENQEPHRPWLGIVIVAETGKIRASNLFPKEPTAPDLYELLIHAMRTPLRRMGKPARPKAIVITPFKDVSGLSTLLSTADPDLEIYQDQMPPEFDEMIADLEENLRGGPEPKGYLSVEGVTRELVGGLFRAAAEFYRAAPWVQLDNYQTIALRHPDESDYRNALVMGQGGVEYGVLMFLRWADVEQQFLNGENPMANIPKDGLYSLWYDTIDKVPFADLEAIEEFGWEIAEPGAYPISVIVERGGTMRRPSRQDLAWYEAALLAIPVLVRDHLRASRASGINSSPFAPVETTIDVMTHAGTVSVEVKYPAGEIPRAEQPVMIPVWDPDEDNDEELPVIDRRAIEGDMFQFAGFFGAREGEQAPALEAAQAVMYRAWGEINPARRIILAHDALALSEDCADAYVMLAEEEADTLSRALEYYQQGMAAGERALGKAYFDEYTGHFWGLLETRPYMRAREGVARILWQMNRGDKALEHYQEMLVLNPNDNQGVRYLMLQLLLQMERYEDVKELLKMYRDDWSSEWVYTRALLAFRRYGPKARAASALEKAIEQNPHVLPYLTGKKRIPQRKPDYIGMGDQREAIAYAGEHLNNWRRVSGAVDWLKTAMADQRDRKKTVPRKSRGAQSKARK